ncbi:CW-type Zinc Finger protein, partial [Toxoplasma gondii CAST]
EEAKETEETEKEAKETEKAEEEAKETEETEKEAKETEKAEEEAKETEETEKEAKETEKAEEEAKETEETEKEAKETEKAEEEAKETEETEKEAKETEKAEEAEAVGTGGFPREKQRNKQEEKLTKPGDEEEVARIEEETSEQAEGKREKAAKDGDVPGKKEEQGKEGGESSVLGGPEETPAAKETVFSAPQEGDSVQGSAGGMPVTEKRSCSVRGEAEKLEETEEEDLALPSSHTARKRKHSVLSSSSEDEKERGEAGGKDTETTKRAEISAEQSSALVAQATLHMSAPAAAKTRSGGAKKRKKNKKKNKSKASETHRLSPATEETRKPASLESQIRNSSRPPALVEPVRQQSSCPTASCDASSLSLTVLAVSPSGPLPSSARLESAWKSDRQGVSADPTKDLTPGDSGGSASESNLAAAENRCRLSDSRVEADCEEEERSLESNSGKKVEGLQDEKATALPSGEKNSSSLRSSEVPPEERRFSRNTTSARGSASQSSSFVSTSSLSSVCLSRSTSPPAVSQTALKAEARCPPEDGSVSGLSRVSEPHSDCASSFFSPTKEPACKNGAPADGPAPSRSAEEKNVASEAAPSEAKGADPGGDGAFVFLSTEAAREEREKFGDEEGLEEGVRSGARRSLRDREENSGSLLLRGVEVEGGSRTCSNSRQRDSDVSEPRSGPSRRESPRRDFSTVHDQRKDPGEPQRARGRSRSPSEPGLPPPSPMSSPPSPGPRDSSGFFGDSPRSAPSSPGASALPPAVPVDLASLPPARAGPFRTSAFAFSPHASLQRGPAPVGLHRPLLGHPPREGDGLLGPGRPVGSGSSGGPRPPFERSWEKRQGFFGPRRGAGLEPEGDEFSGSKGTRGFNGGDRDAERNGDRRDAGPRGPSGDAGAGRPSSPTGSGVSGGKGAGGRSVVFTGDSGVSKEVELDSASGGSRRGSGTSALSLAPVTVLAPPAGESSARPVCPRILNLPSHLSSGSFGRAAFFSRSGRGESAHFNEDDFKGCGAASGSPSGSEGRALLGLGPKARAPFGPEKRDWGDRRPGYEGERGADSQWGFSEAPKGPEHARLLPGFPSGGRVQFWSGGSFYAGGEDASVSSPSGASVSFGGSGGEFPARPAAPPVLLPPPSSSFNSKSGFSAYGPGGAQLAGDSGDGALRPVPRRSDSWGDEERGERRRGGGGSGADSFFYQGEDGASFSFSSFHRNRETRDVYAGGDGAVLRPGAGGGVWHGGERRSSRELGGSGYRASHRRRED